ncbi:galactoside 2-alpha-L-fucosyltransferase-like [Miscanthus floridulus]|uniref:galactoside 2-alpha-L-fucosyltransferase-like n=1 Tax=Miscanthus floridulus TaxID=154761 RepID=UPI00345A0321
MVLLSFSNAVVTTTVSTFGYVSQGLAGLRPWVLMSPVDGKAPGTLCQRPATIEPCFHASPNYNCRAKVNGDSGRMVRHIRHCEDLPLGVHSIYSEKLLKLECDNMRYENPFGEIFVENLIVGIGHLGDDHP